MSSEANVLRLGDRVQFDGDEHTVVGLTGTAVRLHRLGAGDSVVMLVHLMADPEFCLLDHDRPEAQRLSEYGLLDGLAPKVVERAAAMEAHLIEVETGRAPDAAADALPREGFDPAVTGVEDRAKAKVAELAGTELATSFRSLMRARSRYRDQGLIGLVDRRSLRPSTATGRIDPRVVEAAARLIEAETNTSTGTKARLRRWVGQFLDDTYGPGEVPLPSQTTFYRLAGTLAAERHTFGSAATRRSLAKRPTGSFTATVAARPGGQVQIDSTPLDVMAVFGDGLVGRPELAIAVDVATRTICAVVLRPERAKAVDAALLLARMVVPEPLRPGWDPRLAIETSVLPHEQLQRIDARFEAAAAKPVIVPDSITIDHGKVFVSETFIRACDRLGVSVQMAHPGTPTDKGMVERTFQSINTLFCQHVAGHTGRDVTRRGADVAAEAVWSLPELAEMFEEWIVCGWQTRPHDSLRDPHFPGQALAPNTMFANLVAAAGYLPLPLTGEDYIELLPVVWRSVNDYGIRIAHRTYDARELGKYRRQSSGATAKRGLWEVHCDPYDLSCVWVRDRHRGTWIRAEWSHYGIVGQPFGDLAWRQARALAVAAGQGKNQTAVAHHLNELLRRAGTGPGPTVPAAVKDQLATRMPMRPALEAPVDAVDADDEDQDLPEPIVPLGVFDPIEDYR